MHRRLFLKLATTAAGLFSLFGLSRLALLGFRNHKPKTIADNTAWIQKKIDHQARRGGGLLKINCDDLANNYGELSADDLHVYGGVSLVFFNTRGRQWAARGWLVDGSKHKNRNLIGFNYHGFVFPAEGVSLGIPTYATKAPTPAPEAIVTFIR